MSVLTNKLTQRKSPAELDSFFIFLVCQGWQNRHHLVLTVYRRLKRR